MSDLFPSHSRHRRKTTLARRLLEALGGETEVNYLSHDSYYRCLKGKPRDERIRTNFDHPDSLETELLLDHIRNLKQGVPCPIPSYNFATHARTEATAPTEPRRIILVEGILIFTHPDLCKELDIKVFVVGYWIRSGVRGYTPD